MCMKVEFSQTNIFWSFDKYNLNFEQIVLVGKRNPTNRQARKLVVTQRDHFRMCRQVDCRRRGAQPRIGSSGPLLTPCYVQSTIQSGAPGVLELLLPDMEFVQNFTPPDFQVKNFTPSISPNFNSFSKKTHKKRVKMEKFTPLAKILHCPALTALTNSTSVAR